MTPNITASTLNTRRARAYVFRLPLFTRAILATIFGCSILSLNPFWDVREWGALVPSKVSIFNGYRITTFPLIHLSVAHSLLNIMALTPLLERFELEHGTLTTLALFMGPLTSIPSVIYLLLNATVLWGDVPIMGASLWVFLLLSWESIRTSRSNPHIIVGTYRVPTWVIPLIMALVVSALIPRTSLAGHLCGIVVGYLFGLGHLQFLHPPERFLRWLEHRLNLLGRLPHYVSIDQKTYGRFGVLPTNGNVGGTVPSVAQWGAHGQSSNLNVVHLPERDSVE